MTTYRITVRATIYEFYDYDGDCLEDALLAYKEGELEERDNEVIAAEIVAVSEKKY